MAYRSGVTPALVTHAHSRAAVAGIRALGAAGVDVIALAHRRDAAGLWSRHASSRALGPPSEEPAAWLERIAEIARRAGPVVVYPGQEEGAAVLPGAALGERAIIPYPDGPALDTLRDKLRVAELSRDAGIPSPTVLAEGPAGQVAAAPPPGPTIVKSPALSDALPAARACSGAEELREILEGLPVDEPVVVQERAEGPLVAVSVVVDRDGAAVAWFQQEAVHLWPAEAGASSLGRSVAPDRDLIDRVVALLRSAGYWGLAQVQLVRTSRGYAAIDVNPRFYGSLPLALRAGVNLPYAWHAVALGQEPPRQTSYRVGVVYRWLEAELTAAWKGDRARLRQAFGPAAGAMWAWSDPLPGAMLAAHIAAPMAGRRISRLTRRAGS